MTTVQAKVKVLTINNIYLEGYEIKVPKVPGENFLQITEHPATRTTNRHFSSAGHLIRF